MIYSTTVGYWLVAVFGMYVLVFGYVPLGWISILLHTDTPVFDDTITLFIGISATIFGVVGTFVGANLAEKL